MVPLMNMMLPTAASHKTTEMPMGTSRARTPNHCAGRTTGYMKNTKSTASAGSIQTASSRVSQNAENEIPSATAHRSVMRRAAWRRIYNPIAQEMVSRASVELIWPRAVVQDPASFSIGLKYRITNAALKKNGLRTSGLIAKHATKHARP